MHPQELVRFLDLDRLPEALLLLVVGVVAARLLSRFLDGIGERFTERRLQLKKAAALSRFAIYVALFLAVSSTVLDLRPETLLAVAGTLGLALGFAFKDLLASLMAGVLLLVDEPFQVGDRIHFGGWYGEVTEIGLRSVRLRTLDDNTVTIPNSRFLTEATASANAGALPCMVVVPIYLRPDQDFVAARRLLLEVAATSRYVFLDKPLVVLVADEVLGERFVMVLRLKAYVFDARHEQAFSSDVTERARLALRAAGIRGPGSRAEHDS